MKKNKNKILGIIPARSGSKGVKNKNIKHLNHKPLVHYTIEAASNSKIISEFIVSTDSQKYCEYLYGNWYRYSIFKTKRISN